MFHPQRSNIRICLGPGLWLSANVTELRDLKTIISHLEGAVLFFLQLNRWSPVDRQTNLGPTMVPHKLGREDLPCPGHLLPDASSPTWKTPNSSFPNLETLVVYMDGVTLSRSRRLLLLPLPRLSKEMLATGACCLPSGVLASFHESSLTLALSH